MSSSPSSPSTSLLCSNCEFAEAEWRCTACSLAKEDELYCLNCSEIHTKIKRNKDHVFETFVQVSHLCSNCDEQVSTHRCMDCPETEQRLCRNCSLFHSKIKAFKDHRVVQQSKSSHTTTHAGYPINPGGYGRDNISIIYSNPTLIQRFEEIYDDLGTFVAQLHVPGWFDFSSIGIPKAEVYIPLLFCTAFTFLALRPFLGKHGSSLVTLVGSIIVLRIVQSPNWSSNSINNNSSRSGRKAARGQSNADAEPPSIPSLMGSSKFSKQQRNPPLVLRSALSNTTNTVARNSNSTSAYSMDGNGLAVSAGNIKPSAVGKKTIVLQFGAAAGWEDDDDDEFRDEFSYQRCSTAATFQPRGPAYRGRTSSKRKGNGSPTKGFKAPAGETLSDPD